MIENGDIVVSTLLHEPFPSLGTFVLLVLDESRDWAGGRCSLEYIPFLSAYYVYLFSPLHMLSSVLTESLFPACLADILHVPEAKGAHFTALLKSVHILTQTKTVVRILTLFLCNSFDID